MSTTSQKYSEHSKKKSTELKYKIEPVKNSSAPKVVKNFTCSNNEYNAPHNETFDNKSEGQIAKNNHFGKEMAVKKVKIYKYQNLYQLQFKAQELTKKRKSKKNFENAIKIYSNILELIKNYENLNLYDEALTKGQKMQNKLELREIKLSSILLRMKIYKKFQRYEDAFKDSTKLWLLMSPSE